MENYFARTQFGGGKRARAGWLVAFVAVVGLCASNAAYGLQFMLGPNTGMSWVTTLGYSRAWRVESPSEEILSNVNADDGDRAFEEGVIRSQVRLLTELEFHYKNFGLFLRADAWYNQVYNEETDNSSEVTDNSAGSAEEFAPETVEFHRAMVRLLDAFVYGNFKLGGTHLSVRVGRQVVSWGASLFIGGISAVQNPVDVTNIHRAVVEVKSVLLPLGRVLARWQLTPQLSVAGYYTWDWENTELNRTGSYFASTDILAGGDVILARVPGVGVVPALQHVDDNEARSSGQFGFAVNYLVPALNYTNFGFYYLHYHNKIPSVVTGGFVPNPRGPGKIPTTYHAKYFEDIDLYGASFSTAIKRYQFGGEISYKQGTPVTNAKGQLVRADALQVQLNTISHLPWDLLWSDNTTLSAGIAMNMVTDRDGDELKADKRAAMYAASLSFAYNNILPATDLTIPISISQGFYNDAAAAAFTEGNIKVGIGASISYGTAWAFNLNYVQFRGSAEENPLTDRDYVAAKVKYTF